MIEQKGGGSMLEIWYDFVRENTEQLMSAIEKLPDLSPFNREQIEEQFKSLPFYDSSNKSIVGQIDLLDIIASSLNYVKLSDVIDCYKKHAEYLKDLLKINDIDFVLVLPSKYLEKSMFFLSILFTNIMKNDFGIIFNAVFSDYTDVITTYKDTIGSKKFLCLVCDDISYSGIQIIHYIKKDIPTYFVLFGMSRVAFDKISEYTGESSSFTIFNFSIIKVIEHNYKGILLRKTAEKIKDPKNLDILQYWFSRDNLIVTEVLVLKEELYDHSVRYNNYKKTMTYTQFKYPDDMSTFTFGCVQYGTNINLYDWGDWANTVGFTSKEIEILNSPYNSSQENIDFLENILIKMIRYEPKKILREHKVEKIKLINCDEEFTEYLSGKYIHDDKLICNKYCIKPFYKNIKYTYKGKYINKLEGDKFILDDVSGYHVPKF